MAWKFWNNKCCKKPNKFSEERFLRKKHLTNITQNEREESMSRNREFDDALDELKMLHDCKNHDYATADNPYKNLEGVERIGIEAWRGIVIRLMDKFERVQQYCVNGDLKIKSEGIEDTFKDIAVYSTLAMILFRKDQDKQQELTELERGKCSTDYGEPRFQIRPDMEPVDDKYNADESYTHPTIAMREAAEKQQAMEDTERLRETLQAREDRKEEERLVNDKKDFLSAIDKLEAERRARDN
jgi:hypothetical protein